MREGVIGEGEMEEMGRGEGGGGWEEKGEENAERMDGVGGKEGGDVRRKEEGRKKRREKGGKGRGEDKGRPQRKHPYLSRGEIGLSRSI